MLPTPLLIVISVFQYCCANCELCVCAFVCKCQSFVDAYTIKMYTKTNLYRIERIPCVVYGPFDFCALCCAAHDVETANVA